MAELKPFLIFAGLHVFAFALGVGMFVLFLRSDDTRSDDGPDDRTDGQDDEGGSAKPSPPPRPLGGPPLISIPSARARLRGPTRIADLAPRPARRREHGPRPAPVRQPAGPARYPDADRDPRVG